MKIMIINAFGRSNRGDAVLLDECITEIQATWPKASIGCAVFEGVTIAKETHRDIIWSERIGNTKQKGWKAKLITLSLLAIAGAAKISKLKFLANLLPVNQRESWKMIIDADVIVSAPGGYIHDTNFAYFVALFHIWLGQNRTRKIFLAPQSIGPIDFSPSQWLAKKILTNCNAICARESYTYNFLIENLNIPQKIVHRSGDSAFWNFDVQNDLRNQSEMWRQIGVDPTETPIFGITVVDWPFPKSRTPEIQRQEYTTTIARLAELMSTRYGLHPVIFNQVSEDLSMAERIAAECKIPITLDKVSREPADLRALIARSSVFLGTRFHSCIFAMMEGVPTTAIAYLPKTSYILRDLQLEHRQIPIDLIDFKLLISKLENDLVDLPTARMEIEQSVSIYRENHTRFRDVLEAN